MISRDLPDGEYTLNGNPFTCISLWGGSGTRPIECNICGCEWESGWGVPVWNGVRVANDWPGEWGGVPVCEPCFHRHAAGEFIEVPTFEYDAARCGVSNR